MAVMIKTVDLRKAYRIGNEKVVALERINLEIEEGQVCCILGTSGSGKSTLLNQLAGLEKPTRGDVIVRGKMISKMTEKELALFRQESIGFVFQSYNLLPGMTAIENVAMPLTFRGMRRKERTNLAIRMLEQVGLGERMKHTPSEMSGGQQQRVGIARAFVANPAVVFADEPTGNLDTKTTKEIMNLFLDFSRTRGTTIVLVTHDRNLANYADRIVTIVDGAVVSDTPNKSLYEVEKEEEAAKGPERGPEPPEEGQTEGRLGFRKPEDAPEEPPERERETVPPEAVETQVPAEQIPPSHTAGEPKNSEAKALEEK